MPVASVSITAITGTAIPNTQWRLEVQLDSSVTVTPSTITVAFAAASSGVTPAVTTTLGSSTRITYQPPVPSLTVSSPTALPGSPVTVTASFSSPVLGLVAADFVVKVLDAVSRLALPGTVTRQLTKVGESLYSLSLTVDLAAAPQPGSSPIATVALPGAIAGVAPASAPSNTITIALQGPTVALSHGAVAPSSLQVPITATFSTDVTGVAVSDFLISAVTVNELGYSTSIIHGAVTSALQTASPRLYSLTVTLPDPVAMAEVRVSITPQSGSIYPPNAASSPVLLRIPVRSPTPTLSTSHATASGTVFGSDTIITASFNSAVSGVGAAAFTVVIASGSGPASITSVSRVSDTLYEATLHIGSAGTTVSLSMAASAPGIAPRNAASKQPLVLTRGTAQATVAVAPSTGTETYVVPPCTAPPSTVASHIG